VAGLGSDVAVFVHATDLAWLDEDHLVASLEIGVQPNRFEFLAVLFEGARVIGSTTNFGFLVRNWFVSPSGSFAGAENGTIVARDGDFTDPPQNLPEGRAVAFSPDEQWLAYVTDTSIYLVGTPRNSEPGRVIRLPIAAQDLVWDPVSRGTAIGPPIRR
jgi:hypothetical protein